MDPHPPGVDGQPRAALGHVERVGDPDHARLERVGLAAAAVADDRVQRLGDHDRSLGLRIDVVEQLAAACPRRGRGCRPRGRCGGSTCRRRGAAPRPRRPPRRRGRACRGRRPSPARLPALTSSRSSRRAMLSTIWTWTQLWSDIPSRSEVTCAMCHQAQHLRVGVDAVEQGVEPAVAARRRPDRGPGDRLGMACGRARPGPRPALETRSARRSRPSAYPRPSPRFFRPRRGLTWPRSGWRCGERRTPSALDTGLMLPECSCAHCVRDQVQRFRPELLEADPVGEIRVTRNAPAAERRSGSTPGLALDA